MIPPPGFDPSLQRLAPDPHLQRLSLPHASAATIPGVLNPVPAPSPCCHTPHNHTKFTWPKNWENYLHKNKPQLPMIAQFGSSVNATTVFETAIKLTKSSSYTIAQTDTNHLQNNHPIPTLLASITIHHKGISLDFQDQIYLNQFSQHHKLVLPKPFCASRLPLRAQHKPDCSTPDCTRILQHLHKLAIFRSVSECIYI